MPTIMKDEFKVEAFRFVTDNGTAAGTYDDDYTPDDSFDEVIGICTFENADGNLTNGYYRTGIKTEEKAYAELAHKNLLMASANIAQKEKFMPVNIPIRKKRDIKVQVSFDAALGAALDVEYCFLLRRKVAVQE
jgi:hypothetical protein